MKSAPVSLEARNIQSAAQNENTRSAVFDRHLLIVGLWVFAGYYLGCKIGFALTFKPHPVSVLWPPNSVLVAALLVTPPRRWWVVLLAALPAHLAAQLQSHVAPLMTLCWFISNSCEAVIGAGLMRYLVGGPIRFTSLRNVGLFCLCVVFVGPFLSSFLDAAFVVWNRWGQDGYWELIRIRLSSNAVSALIIVPVIVTWVTNGVQLLRTTSRSRYLEACAVFLGLLAVSYGVLYELRSGTDLALLFLPLPFLLWAAIRFGALGASTAISIVGFLAIWSASHGHGPFSAETAEQSALSIEIFLIGLAIPLLFLAALIEERLTGENELRESEERMRVAAEAVNLGIWEWDLSKAEIWATNARRALLGWPASGKIALNDFMCRLHPDDRDRVRHTMDDAIRSGKDFDSEYRLILPDEMVRWMSTRGTVHFDDAGKPARILGISLDITARKQAELDAQRDRAELSHLSRVALMGEMSASIAHELNQPLAGILSNAAAGQRFIDRGDVNLREIREMFGDIIADGRRASDVVRGIRGMVKKEQAERRSVDLNDVVTDALRMASPDAVLRSCQLETSLDANLPAIDGDPVQLQQVLLNLVINAFDAMRDTPPPRRKVVIATQSNGNGTVCTSVRDHGVGISEDMRNRLFDPFFSTKTEGLGMGLAIVRSIIEAHGGTITAENLNDGGARFEFVLPVNGHSSA
jgi:two-component system, LuxR family, sensor kinase FixL